MEEEPANGINTDAFNTPMLTNQMATPGQAYNEQNYNVVGNARINCKDYQELLNLANRVDDFEMVIVCLSTK